MAKTVQNDGFYKRQKLQKRRKFWNIQECKVNKGGCSIPPRFVVCNALQQNCIFKSPFKNSLE